MGRVGELAGGCADRQDAGGDLAGVGERSREPFLCPRAAPVGVQQQLVEEEPERFFRPPYVGHRGWLGVRLDADLDGDELAGIVEDAYRCIAPKTLVAQLDELTPEELLELNVPTGMPLHYALDPQTLRPLVRGGRYLAPDAAARAAAQVAAQGQEPLDAAGAPAVPRTLRR